MKTCRSTCETGRAGSSDARCSPHTLFCAVRLAVTVMAAALLVSSFLPRVALAAERAGLIAPEEVAAGEETPIGVQLVDAAGEPAAGVAEVCVTAAQEHGGEPVMGPDPVPGEPGRVCVVTDEETGSASVLLTATKAEPVTLSAVSDGLPGSGQDDEVTVLVLPGAPNHARLTPPEEPVRGCHPGSVEIQIEDEFENAVEEMVELTIGVDAPEGAPSIVEAFLLGFDSGDLPAVEVTGTTDASGWGRVVVELDAAVDLEIAWSSTDLAGDPADHGATVEFVVGPVSPSASEIAASTTTVSLGGSAQIEVVPMDSCGLLVGSGRDVLLDDPGPAIEISPVVDQEDGTYTAEATAASCPATEQIGAEVDGVRLYATLAISTICVSADPELSIVQARDEEVRACAADGIGARLLVVALDEDGNDLGQSLDVAVEEDPPYVVQVGDGDSEVDPDTGNTLHELVVGSSRCGSDPRPISVSAGGVMLEDEPMVTFTCPAVDPASVDYDAEPSRAPVGGTEPVVVTVRAQDTCGNPAFGREASIELTADLESQVSPESGVTHDEPGSELDGAAIFEVQSPSAGQSGVIATVDGVPMLPSPEDLITFESDELLTLAYRSGVSRAVVGQVVTLTVTIENLHHGTLTDLRIVTDHEGLSTVGAGGAVLEDDGTIMLARIGGESTHDVRIDAQVLTGASVAKSAVSVLSSGPGDPVATSEPVSIHVEGAAHGGGCECAGASGSSSAGRLIGLLLLFMIVFSRLGGYCRRSAGGGRRA